MSYSYKPSHPIVKSRHDKKSRRAYARITMEFEFERTDDETYQCEHHIEDYNDVRSFMARRHCELVCD